MPTKKVSPPPETENSHYEGLEDVSGFEKPIFSPEEIEEYGQLKGWMRAVVHGEGACIEIKMSGKDLANVFEGWMRNIPSIEDVMIEALRRHNMRQFMEHIFSDEEKKD
jgi:hypothetical protein